MEPVEQQDQHTHESHREGSKQHETMVQEDPIDLTVGSMTGDPLAEMRVDGSWTAQQAARALAELVPPPPRTTYQLVVDAEALPDKDQLRKHISGDHVEAMAFTRSMGQIAAGEYFTVALTAAGVQQFGRSHGEEGRPFSCDPPNDISFNEVQQVVCGYRYAAALLTNGEVRFWGSGADGVGQIPNFEGVRVASLGNCRSVIRNGHAAVVLEDGTVRCWGANEGGQCDVPVLPIGRRAVQVTGGRAHTVVLLDDGSLDFWGDFNSDWLENDDFHVVQSEPIDVAASKPITDDPLEKEPIDEPASKQIKEAIPRIRPRYFFSKGRRAIFVDAANYHNIVLLDDGSFVLFGGGYTDNARTKLAQDAAGRRAVAVSAGNKNYIVLLEDGDVITAGYAQSDFLASYIAGVNVVGIAAGEWHCAVLLDDGRVVGWGDDDHGEYPERLNGEPRLAESSDSLSDMSLFS
eukprot:TRINITY_DN9148_c0_g1_i2.p1 TRINITY_DN9148_c0_g1~~TRINITY_DN9148_c0_g1_i2.p1  ORF type:complete len:490 (+),score=59.42 TRINITY_DN9148_c0_g1_i2:85-1470(+)